MTYAFNIIHLRLRNVSVIVISVILRLQCVLELSEACLLSVWATITEFHRMGGLNNKHLFLVVLEVRKPNIKVPANSIPSESSLADSCLLEVCSHDRRERSSFSNLPTNPIQAGLTS